MNHDAFCAAPLFASCFPIKQGLQLGIYLRFEAAQSIKTNGHERIQFHAEVDHNPTLVLSPRKPTSSCFNSWSSNYHHCDRP